MARSPKDDNAALVRAYLDWQQNQRGRSPRTVYDYAHRLASLLDWLGYTPLEAATLEQFEGWVQRTRGGNAIGSAGRPATKAKDVAVVRSLYSYLEGHRLIALNPSKNLHGPTVHNVQPRPVPEDTWAYLWPKLPDEARVVYGLGFYVGLRRAEIAELRVDQVSVLSQQLMGFKRKGGGTDVTPYGEMVGVFADLLPHLIPGGIDSFLVPLHTLVEQRGGRRYLLPWGEQQSPQALKRRTHGLHDDVANDPDWVNKNVKRWNRRCGLNQYDVTPHMLRHSTASYLLKAGMPIEMVAELLNHSNIQITRRYAKIGTSGVAAWRRRVRPAGLLPLPLDLSHYGRQ
jgi:site-specific recombinase XerD